MSLEVVSLIVGVVSILLALFAMFLSYFFYKSSKDESAKISSMTSSINDNINVLSSSFDKFLDRAFAIIEANSNAMQNKLFGNTSAVSDGEPSDDFSILSFIAKKRCVKILKIVQSLNIDYNKIKIVLERLQSQNIIEINGDVVLLKNNSNSSSLMESSEPKRK